MTDREAQPHDVGDRVADAELLEHLGAGCGIALFRASRQDGSELTVVAPEGLGEASRERFVAAAERLDDRVTSPLEGVATAETIDRDSGAYLLDVVPSGTIADIPLLSWSSDQKVDLIRAVSRALSRLHAAAGPHGCLHPEAVVLDVDLKPHVINAGGIDVAAEHREASSLVEPLQPWTAPEARHGRPPDPQADVYSLGRLLHFLMIGRIPEARDEKVPALKTLEGQPPGLVRIVRKCTTVDPECRYASAEALAEELEQYGRDEPVGMDASGNDLTPERATPKSMRSQRPRSDRPSKRSGARGAQEAGGRKDGAGTWWSPAIGAGGAIVAIGLTVTTLVLSRGDESRPWLLALALAAPLALAVAPPPRTRRPALMRLAVVAVGAAAVVVLDPAGVFSERPAKLGRLNASDVTARVAQLEELKASGETAFRQNDLSGADLSGKDLSNLEFDGSSLSGCHCAGADFTDASMLNVRVDGADFSGANLTGVLADFMKGWEQAACDDQTRMPAGWSCVDGRPAPVEAP